MQALSQTDIVNLALQRLGNRRVMVLADPNDPNAVACTVAWPQALGEVSRDAQWNCLRKRALLSQLAAPPPAAGSTPTPASWSPGTHYNVGDYATFGNPAYLYMCSIANTASGNFTNDLTMGFWFQTDLYAPNFSQQTGNAGPLFEWNFAYALPTDFVMLIMLNGQNCWKGRNVGSHYEIYQKAIYCNTPTADIEYTRYETDPTNFDTLFVGCLAFKLAALVATTLRKDSGQLAAGMEQMYQRALSEARVANAGEGKPRIYNIVSESRFVRSRRRSTNG